MNTHNRVTPSVSKDWPLLIVRHAVDAGADKKRSAIQEKGHTLCNYSLRWMLCIKCVCDFL